MLNMKEKNNHNLFIASKASLKSWALQLIKTFFWLT